MRKAVIYLRVSSKKQEQEGFSIPAQRKLLLDFAKAKGFSVVKEFEDDETAKSAGRENFGLMVDYAKQQKDIEAILVEKTDRLYRNFKDYVTINELGVTVFLVKENEIVGKQASSHQKFIHGIKVLMAKNYIDNLSEEVIKGQTQKADSGIFPGSRLPLGYKMSTDGDKIVPVVDEANKDLPIKMFEYYATGLYSLDSLIKRIKDEGLLRLDLLPKHARLTRMTKSTAHRTLRNPFYYGQFYWNDKLYHGTHQPLIAKDLWDKVQDLLNKTKIKNEPKPKYGTMDFAFKGVLICGECGRTVTAEKKIKKSGKEYVYYHCTKFGGNCSQKAVNETLLDEYVINSLDGLEMPQDAVDYVAEGLKQSLYFKRSTVDRTRVKMEAEKSKLQNRLSVLYEDKLDRNISEEFYNQKFEEYSKKIKDLDTLISTYTYADIDYYQFGSKTLELAKRAAELYKNAKPDEKRELLGFLLQNSSLTAQTPQFTYRKPFDRVRQRALSSDWSG